MPKFLNVTCPLVIVALCVSCGETQSVTYATYAEAIAGDTGHWLPPYLPATATDIREVHYIDSNTQWLRFRVPVGDTSVGIGATRISIDEAASRASKPPRAMGNWLPELRKPSIITRRSGIQAYRHLHLWHPTRCVAVAPADGLVYAWTC